MKPELKKKWVEALRSGKYKQTKDYLKIKKASGYSHCCLGVLCEVAGSRMSPIPDYTISGTVYGVGKEQDAEMLTENMARRFGISLFDAKTLASMNDQGKSFREIATYINRKIK